MAKKRKTKSEKAAENFFHSNYARLADGRHVDIMKMGPMESAAVAFILAGVDPEVASAAAIAEFTEAA